MPIEANRPLVGVLLGFACVFFLFVKREGKKPPADDAELLLQHAQSQMREAQAKNRERAVQAITQKNNLQALVDQTQKMADRLEQRAEAARQEGDSDLEQDLRAERGQYLLTLTQTQASLTSAIEVAEAVKADMRREEEGIRAKTAQALGMKAQYRQAQIELLIEKNRLDMSTTKAGDLFERAQNKIQQAQARRDLMTRIRQAAGALGVAAEAAERGGDAALGWRLLAERDALKKAALDPKLWSG